MKGRAFFDTNVLIYSLAAGDPRRDVSRRLLAEGGVVSVQVLSEFCSVARRKLRLDWPEVDAALDAVRSLCREIVPVTLALHDDGLRIARRYGYHIYDSQMVAAGLAAGCATFYSEDLRDGQVIDGMTIRNPFAA